MARKFEGKTDMDGFYAWLNPKLPHEQKYNPAQLLSSYVEVDKPTYDYFLEILPPMNWSSAGFAICEATMDDIRLAFFQILGRCFAAHISDRDPANKMNAVRDAIALEVR